MKQALDLIYDYFDYELNYKPDYNDPEEAKVLVDYLKDIGYTHQVRKDKVIFKKGHKTIVGCGLTEEKAIVAAFLNFLRSHYETS